MRVNYCFTCFIICDSLHVTVSKSVLFTLSLSTFLEVSLSNGYWMILPNASTFTVFEIVVFFMERIERTDDVWQIVFNKHKNVWQVFYSLLGTPILTVDLTIYLHFSPTHVHLITYGYCIPLPKYKYNIHTTKQSLEHIHNLTNINNRFYFQNWLICRLWQNIFYWLK